MVPAPPEISPLPLHAALPIYPRRQHHVLRERRADRVLLDLRLDPEQRPQQAVDQPAPAAAQGEPGPDGDRKSTRLNSSHANISYAVFCLKKKERKRDEKCKEE